MGIISGSKRAYLRTWLFRLVLFSTMWLILTDGVMNSWFVGVPTVLLVTFFSVLLVPPLSLSLRGIVLFIPYYLWHSIRGGADVAWRAMHPQLPISPALLNYRLRLPPGIPGVYMVVFVGLLPGTLCVESDGESLLVHVIDDTSAIKEELNMLEIRLAKIFGVELEELV